MSAYNAQRVGAGTVALGIANGAYEIALDYVKQRQQFGRPIAEFQGLQWMIADMATRVQAARMLTLNAAYTKDQSKGRYSKEAAMAKLYASETAMDAVIKAVQIHGGYGYTKEYTVERLFRDAKITEIYEGTSEVQRMVIAANLLR